MQKDDQHTLNKENNQSAYNIGQIDDEFLQTMIQIEQKYISLQKQERIRIEQWSKKLCSATTNILWKKNRNNYAKLLLNMINANNLQEPFNKMPPEGPLPKINRFDIPSLFSKVPDFKVPQQNQTQIGKHSKESQSVFNIDQLQKMQQKQQQQVGKPHLNQKQGNAESKEIIGFAETTNNNGTNQEEQNHSLAVQNQRLMLENQQLKQEKESFVALIKKTLIFLNQSRSSILTNKEDDQQDLDKAIQLEMIQMEMKEIIQKQPCDTLRNPLDEINFIDSNDKLFSGTKSQYLGVPLNQESLQLDQETLELIQQFDIFQKRQDKLQSETKSFLQVCDQMKNQNKN